MGRRRVLALAPAITRMQCMANPYRRVKAKKSQEGDHADDDHHQALPRRSSFWSWKNLSRNKKNKKKVKQLGGAHRRRWGFRVASRLRIRLLSPVALLKRLRDAYVNMMLSIERNAGDCSGLIMGPTGAYNPRHHHPMSAYGSGGGVPWVWPALPVL